MDKIRVAVLISGGGSNLQALIDEAAEAHFPAEIVCVISNKERVLGLNRAEKAGIPAHVIPHKGRTREEFESDLQQLLEQYNVQLICLAGFMRILSEEFIEEWPRHILNIHPALLPKFGGEGMYGHHVHEAVIRAGEMESGASVHIVTAGCDEGPVLLRDTVPVMDTDTPDTLAARVLKVEHKIYPQALRQVAAEMLRKASLSS